jgi:hypothetical protein
MIIRFKSFFPTHRTRGTTQRTNARVIRLGELRRRFKPWQLLERLTFHYHQKAAGNLSLSGGQFHRLIRAIRYLSDPKVVI